MLSKIKFFIFLLLIIAFPALAESSIVGAPWPMYQHDIFHTGRTLSVGPEEGEISWQKDIGAGTSSPVVDIDGVIYVGSTQGALYAFYPDGEQKCTCETGAAIEATPLIAPDGTVYVTASDGKLYAVNPDCSVKWSLNIGGGLSAPALGPQERIYVGSSDGFLHAINSMGNSMGQEEWKSSTGEIGPSSPAFDSSGNIYIGSAKGVLFSIRPDGTLRWLYDTKGDITASPVIGKDDTIYIGTITFLVAVRSDGTKKWEFQPSSGIGFFSSPAIGANDALYAGGLDGFIYILNQDSGSIQSTIFTLNLPITAAPALDGNGTMYIGSGDIFFAYGLERNLLWKLTTNGPVEASPALGTNGALYGVSQDGNLYTIGAPDPSFSLSGKINGSLIEGMVVYVSGPEERAARVAAEAGTYGVRGLMPGEYTVTPYKADVLFDPTSKKITLDNNDQSDVSFSVKSIGPSILSAAADPSQVPNDGTTLVLLTAQVFQPSGQTPGSVTVDLSAIGGTAAQTMYDDATQGDAQAGDGIYSFATMVNQTTPVGLTALHVQLSAGTDTLANAVINVEIISDINGSVSGGGTDDQTLNNGTSGQTLLITYSLTGGSELSFGTAAQAPGCIVSLQIIKPDNTLYHTDQPITITSTLSYIEIKNAEAGKWTYRITNSCSMDQQYSISTSSSGTGLVSGIVIDAATGVEIDSADISTDGGGSTKTADGYYFLIQPAGVFTITASAPGHSSATQPVNIQSGG
ncbi:MAG: PQQ-binding-like beta-propeller repeat protein, partial [Proteobacteria bacterium]|nr:PQQ-binding-like beta-propeller repeat protein [Pseudomonadota bacterium]